MPVNYTLNGPDYASVSGTATILANSSQVAIPIYPRYDGVVDGTETVTLTLQPGSGYTVPASPYNSTTMSIAESGFLASVSNTNYVTETRSSDGTSASGAGYFYVNIGSTTPVDLPVSYTMSGSAGNGTDYASLSGTATVPAGSSQVAIQVYPKYDGVVYGTETVTLTLQPGSGYTVPASPYNSTTMSIGEQGFTATISAYGSAIETPSSGYAGGTGSTGTFTVDVGSITSVDLPVTYSLSGTTTNGVDYRTLSGSVTVPAGSQTATIIVQPIYHGEDATTQTVIATLSAGIGYLAAPPASGGAATVAISKSFPHVLISTMYGKDSNDPASTPIPWVMEGRAWTGNVTIAGPSSVDFNPVAKIYQWTFPTGALKGYGLFTTRNDDPSGPYDVFSGDPPEKTVYPTDVKTENFTSDDLIWNDASLQANDHVINTFYWGPGSASLPASGLGPPAPRRVAVAATFKSTIPGAPDFIGTDYVDVYVAAPTGSIALTPPYPPPSMVPSFGTAGLMTAGSVPQIQFDVNFNSTAPNTPVGISWTASVDPTAPGIGTVAGQFAVTQTMTYDSTRSSDLGGGRILTQADGLLPGRVNPGTILDALHYPTNAAGGGTGTIQLVGSDATGSPLTIRGNDSPGSPVSSPTAGSKRNFRRADDFVMTLMYRPSPLSGIWVPVGQLSWSWTASADHVGTWVLIASNQTRGTYAPTSAFPMWKHTFNELTAPSATRWQSLN